MSSAIQGEHLRRIPSVDRVMALPEIGSLADRYGRDFVVSQVRRLLSEVRQAVMESDAALAQTGDAEIVGILRSRLEQSGLPHLRRVFNLTGTVLHTNLGRALLAQSAIEQVVAVMGEDCNLEIDLETGRRGERDAAVEALLCELTGAEAAIVVNNNAAAVLLTIAALARGKQVIVSRGELVEIGGSFRMPDVMASAGARLVEVGTTNRTHAADYESAIGARTALLLKVHTSNYRVEGFTAAVPEAEIARIAHAHGLPYAYDLGSGSLIDMARYGLPSEPLPSEALRAGADVVTFSGDKLLGGPQAGLIVGARAQLDRLRKHPMKRALRASKMTLAALEATLRLYRDEKQAAVSVPTLARLTRPLEQVREAALRLLPVVAGAVGPAFDVEAAEMASQIGSGSMPTDVFPSWGLTLRRARAAAAGAGTLEGLARSLRLLPVPVVGRLHDKRLYLDFRCLTDEALFAKQLSEFPAPGA